MKELKIWYQNHVTSIRITRFFLISAILLFIVWIVDIKYTGIKDYLPQSILLTTSISSKFLANLSGVFLTVSTFTFTTILSVAAGHAGSLSPRIIRNFVDQKNILSLIGIFTGGFFYTILSLFMLQKHTDNEFIIAGTIGVAYAISSMIYFLLFVYQVLKYAQGSAIIQDCYERGEKIIQLEAKNRKESERFSEKEINTTIPLYSNDTGYIFSVDYDKIYKIMGELVFELVIIKKYSEYVAKGEHIADINFVEKVDKDDLMEEKINEITECINMNISPNPMQDYHYEIKNLREISLRNLSNSSHSFDTASNSISKMSILLGKLFSCKNEFVVINKNEFSRIIYTSFGVDDELYMAFNQIIFYAQGDPEISRHILDSIYKIYLISDVSALNSIYKFFNETYNVLYSKLNSESDKRYIDKIFEQFKYNRHYESDREMAREEVE